MAQMVRAIYQMGIKVVVFGPSLETPFNVPSCLYAHLTSATACTMPLSQGINLAGLAAERAAVTAAGGEYVELQNWFCTSKPAQQSSATSRCGATITTSPRSIRRISVR
jgi:hypothetical protein